MPASPHPIPTLCVWTVGGKGGDTGRLLKLLLNNSKVLYTRNFFVLISGLQDPKLLGSLCPDFLVDQLGLPQSAEQCDFAQISYVLTNLDPPFFKITRAW